MRRQIGRNGVRSIPFEFRQKNQDRAAIAAVVLLFLTATLIAQPQHPVLEGVVKSTSGTTLSNATVTLDDQDERSILSVLTNASGQYQIAAAKEGVYSVKVHCSGYQDALRVGLVFKGNQRLKLNFVLKPEMSPHLHPAAQSSLGEVTFYKGAEFKSGSLKDPSAGGGYSDAASVEGSQMVKQYLSPGQPPPALNAGHGKPNLTETTLSEARWEHSGAALLSRRDFARAVPMYRKALLQYPRSARLEMGLGISLYGQGEYAAAVQSLSAAARLSPDDSSSCRLLSEAMQYTSSPDPEAMRILRRFAKVHPRNAIGHYAYAMGLWKTFAAGREARSLAHAQSELEEATSLDPQLAAAHFQLGLVYDRKKQTSLAIREYQATARLKPDLAMAHYRLALDYDRSGAREKAVAEDEIFEKLHQRGGK